MCNQATTLIDLAGTFAVKSRFAANLGMLSTCWVSSRLFTDGTRVRWKSGNCAELVWNQEMVADEGKVGYLHNQPQPAKQTV